MASNDFFIRIVLEAQSKIAPVLAGAAASAEALQKKFDGANDSAKKLDSSVEKLTGRVDKATAALRSINPTLKTLDGRLDSLAERTAVANKELGKVGDQAGKAAAGLKILDGVIAQVQKKVEQLDARLTEMNARRYEPKLDVKVGEAEAKVDALTKQLASAARGVYTAKTDVEIGAALAKVEALRKELNSLGRGQRAEQLIIQINDHQIDEAQRKLKELRAESLKGGTYEVNVKDAQVDLLLAKLAAATRKSYKLDTEVETGAAMREIDRLRAKLATLGAGNKADRLIMQIDANVDSAAADVELKRLAEEADRISRKPLTIRGIVSGDVDRELDKVRRKMLEIAGLRVSPNVGLEDAGAKVKLDVLEARLIRLGLRSPRVRVVVDTDQAGSKIDQFVAYLGQKGREGGDRFGAGFSGLSAKLRDNLIGLALVFVGPLLSAITAIGGSLVALAASAGIAAGGLAGLAAAAAAQAAPAFALLTLGIARLVAVIKVSSLAQQEADKGGVQSAKIDNQKANAVDALTQAQQGLVNAQQNAIDAQNKLNDARQQGIRTLTDMRLAEERSNLSAQQSRLANVVARVSGTGGLGQADALQQESNDVEARRATQDNQKAQAGGIEGLPAVVAAKKAVDDAQKAVENANRSVQQAKRGLDQAAGSMGAAASAYDIALAKLSAGERQLLASVNRFKALFGKDGPLRGISDNIAIGFARAIDSVGKELQDPKILASLSKLSTAMGNAIAAMAKFFTTGPMRDALAFFSDSMAKNVKPATKVFEDLALIFVNIARAASTALHSALVQTGDSLDNIAKKTGTLAGQKSLEKFFKDSIRTIGDFLKFGAAVIKLFAAVAEARERGSKVDPGSTGIESATKAIDNATKWVKSHGDQVAKFLRQALNGAGDVLKIVLAIGKALVKTFDENSVKQFSDFMSKIVVPVAAGFVAIMNKVVGVLLAIANSPVGGFLIKMAANAIGVAFAISKIISIVSALAPIIGALITVFRTLFTLLMSGNPFAWAALAIVALIELYKHSKTFRDIINAVFDFIKDHWKDVADILLWPVKAIINLIKHFGDIKKAVGDVVDAVIDFFRSLPGKLENFAESAAKTVVNAFKDVGEDILKGIIGGIKAVGNFAKDLVNAFIDLFNHAIPDKIHIPVVGDVHLPKNPIPHIATGARIAGNPQDGDSVPALLKPGEVVLNESQQKMVGPARINNALSSTNAPVIGERGGRYATGVGRAAESNASTNKSKLAPIDLSAFSEAYDSLVRMTLAQTGAIADAFKNLAKSISDSLDDIGHDSRTSWHDLNDSLDSNMTTFEKRWLDAMKNVAQATFDAFKYISDATNSALKAFNADPVKVSITAPQIQSNAEAKADGGYVGMPGERGKDQVHTVLGRGELVLNSTQQFLANAAMAGQDTLSNIVNRAKGLHAGTVLQAVGHAAGGFVNNVGAHIDTSAERSIASRLDKLGKKLGIVFSPAGPRSARRTPAENAAVDGSPTSNHLRGLAMDVAPEAIKTVSNAILNSFGLNRPMPGGWTSPTGGLHDERNHIELLKGAVSGAISAVSTAIQKIAKPKITGADSAGGQVVSTTIDSVIKAANKLIAKSSEKAGGGGDGSTPSGDDHPQGGGAAGPAQVRKWAAQALHITGKYSAENLNALVGRIMFESSGNPKSINLTDSNAAAGHPSKGLAQTIDSTFQTYRLKSLPNDIYDPIANLVAAIRYMYARYGHIMGNTGIGYAEGGEVGGVGTGTSDSNWAKVSKGEHILTAAEVAAAGGHKVIYALRKMLNGGAQAAGNAYAAGGAVGRAATSAYSNIYADRTPTLTSLLAPIQSATSADAAKKAVKDFTDTISEYSIKTLKQVQDEVQKSLGNKKLSDTVKKSLEEIDKSLKKHISDPLTIVVDYLGRLTTGDDIKGVQRAIDRMVQSIATIANGVIPTGDLVSDAKIDFKKSSTKAISRVINAIDFLASDQGPFAAFEAAVTAKATQAQTALSRRTNKVDANGNVTAGLDPQAVAQQQIANDVATRNAYQDERSSINRATTLAQSALKNARTKKQRDTARSDLQKLNARGIAVDANIASTEAQIVQTTYQAQSDKTNSITSFYDDYRTGQDQARRKLAVTGGSQAQVADSYDKSIGANQAELWQLGGQLNAAKATGNTQLAQQIQSQINELDTSVYELAASKVQSAVTEIQKQAQAANSSLDIAKRIRAVTSGGGIGDLIDGQINIARDEIGKLTEQMNQASAWNNTDLAQQLQAQIADLNASLYELADQKIQDAISQINKAAERREASISLTERLGDLQTAAGDALGGLRTRGQALVARGSSLQDQINQLAGQRNNAYAIGDTQLGDQLSDQIGDLNMALQENTQAQKDQVFAIRKLSTDIITGASTRSTGLISQGGSILTNIASASGQSDVNNQINTLMLTGKALASEFDGLLGQIQDSVQQGEFGATGSSILTQLQVGAQQNPAAFATILQQLAPVIAQFESTLGPQALSAFQGLVDGLTSNEVAVTQNTAALKSLNTSVAQTFTSTAWSTFRQAIFNGNGGLLPQYNIPQMETGGYITKGGLFELHAGEKVTPASMVNNEGGDTYVNVNVTNPTEVADPDYLGKRIAWNINGSGRK